MMATRKTKSNTFIYIYTVHTYIHVHKIVNETLKSHAIGVEKNHARNCERFTEDIKFRTDTCACHSEEIHTRHIMKT